MSKKNIIALAAVYNMTLTYEIDNRTYRCWQLMMHGKVVDKFISLSDVGKYLKKKDE